MLFSVSVSLLMWIPLFVANVLPDSCRIADFQTLVGNYLPWILIATELISIHIVSYVVGVARQRQPKVAATRVCS